METNQYYYIAVLGNYYMPDIQCKRSVSWVENENGYPKTYQTIKDAKAAIIVMDAGTYVLHHNEFGRPDYKVVKSADYEYISTGRFGDGSNYDWDGAECGCGECDTCNQMMIDQDREYVRKNQC